MTILVHKLSFEEAWRSTTVFYLDNRLESEIDDETDRLLTLAGGTGQQTDRYVTTDDLAHFLGQADRALDVVIYDIGLSVEKLMRIISLLRILGRVPGGFDREWSAERIKHKLRTDAGFARLVADLLMDGARDPTLAQHIPRYYLETLNYREIQTSSQTARRIRYKRALIGTYAGRKGYRVEAQIQGLLDDVQRQYGVGYAKGRSDLVDTNIDFAIPNLDDPWVIVMCSFQETTSSGQSAKARDMLSAYQNVERRNSRYGERRVFVNFVDGGGWLARRRDFERLVEHCHYFINLAHLDMLHGIILQHVPRQYLERSRQT